MAGMFKLEVLHQVELWWFSEGYGSKNNVDARVSIFEDSSSLLLHIPSQSVLRWKDSYTYQGYFSG